MNHQCKSCSVELEAERLPRGWKRFGESSYCPRCIESGFSLVSLRLPIVSVHEENSDDTKAGWESFRKSSWSAWSDATRYANACVTHYALCESTIDLIPTPEGPRLPKIPPETQNLWRRECYAKREPFTGIDATSAAAISLEAWSTWRKVRWDVRVTNKKSLPSYRYPFPVPIPAQSARWNVADGNGYVKCRIRIASVPYMVRVGAGNKMQYTRNLAAVRDAIASDMTREVALIDRDGAPWLAVSAYRKKRNNSIETDRVMTVKVGGGSLFRAVIADSEKVWALNCDDFLPRIEAYERARQRRSEDRKFERRRGFHRARYGAMSEDRTQRQHDWVSTQLHRRSRELVDFAARNRCGKISIDASERISGMPLFRLLEMVRQKASEHAIVVTVHGDDIPATAKVA
jgi:hypothetical protein